MDEINKNIQHHGVQEAIPSIKLYDYEAVCGAVEETIEYPETFCLNEVEMGTVVKNQGTVGACVACATSTAIEALKLRSALNLKEWEELTPEMFEQMKDKVFDNDEISEGYTYATCRHDNSTGYGMFVSLALDYLRKKGTVPKKYFNILEEMPEMKKIAANFPELVEEALKYRIESYVQLNHANKTKKDNMIKEALMKYRVPLVCVAPEKFGEKHCICIVGWNDEKDSWTIKNSWGTKYGKNGIADIKRNCINSEVYLLMDKEIKVPFTDVSEDDWFYPGVKQAYMSGLMNGKSATEFDPQGNLTRAEFATALSRLMQKMDERLDTLSRVLEQKLK